MLLYLHIGTHKTGSTAIQVFFDANREKLEERGVLFPCSGRSIRQKTSTGHHRLAWELLHPARARRRRARAAGSDGGEWQALATELHDAEQPIALVSSETFDRLASGEQLEMVRSHLANVDVRVIVYLRRQDEFLSSFYCQNVLFHGETRGFDEFRRSVETANYARLLSRWEKTFGREALIVRPYERSALTNGDVVDDICEMIGIDPGPEAVRPPPDVRMNRSYPRNVVNCVRWARKAGMVEDEVAELRELLSLIYRGRRTDADYLSPVRRAGLLEEFERPNSSVARRYLGRKDGVLFADLELPDQEAWTKRYDGAFADLMTTIADARSALSQRPPSSHAPRRERSGGGRTRGEPETPRGRSPSRRAKAQDELDVVPGDDDSRGPVGSRDLPLLPGA